MAEINNKTKNIRLRGDVGYWDFDYDYIQWILDSYGDYEIVVDISSYGGNLNDSLLISDAFAKHGNVKVHYTGFNASAATVASLGAAHVSIDTAAFYLVHKCSVPVIEIAYMNADQLRKFAETANDSASQLDKVDLSIAGLYARRCKKTQAELLDLMKEGKWLTAEEALEWGFVDEVTSYIEDAAEEPSPELVSAMATSGTPIPIELLPDEKGLKNLLKKINSAFESFFNISNRTTKNIMDRIFNFLCALLSVESISFVDNAATLTQEQVLAIESELENLHNQIAQLQSDVESRNSRIQELEGLAGAEPPKVVQNQNNQCKNSALNDYYTKLQSAKESFKNIH